MKYWLGIAFSLCFQLSLHADQPPPKKHKPQFVGVRRSEQPPKKKSSKSRKVKNKWCVSKTHPKVNKNAYVEEEEELSKDAPYYIKTSSLLVQAPSLNSEESESALQEEEEDFPKNRNNRRRVRDF